jgi:hypothetical protein
MGRPGGGGREGQQGAAADSRQPAAAPTAAHLPQRLVVLHRVADMHQHGALHLLQHDGGRAALLQLGLRLLR